MLAHADCSVSTLELALHRKASARETGFEYVLQKDDLAFFRKRK